MQDRIRLLINSVCLGSYLIQIYINLFLVYNFENFKLQAKQNMLDVKKQRLDVACQEVG